MARSLIRQLEQIMRASIYDDAIVDVNTSAIAEPTISGSLEDDTNVIRTLIKQIKGTTNWYDAPTKYFDPANTDGSNTDNKDTILSNISGNTLDSKTIILAVSDDNSGAGYTVNNTYAGFLLTTTTRYADDSNRLGLPIFASTANNGSYHDESGSDNVCRIDIINTETDASIVTSAGYEVYAKFHDGADYSGTGDGTDVYVKFYANGTAINLSSVSETITNIKIVYPLRKRLSDLEEYEWMRTDFVSSWEGDIELTDDINNLWSYTGASNDTDSATGTWTNTTASYILQSDPSTLKSAIDLINTGVGDRSYSESNYITSGESISDSLDSLDQEVKDLSDSIAAITGEEKYVESVASLISKNIAHTLPYSITYTPDSTAGREGKNLDVYVDGQLLAADTGVAGVNADRDYAETSTTSITFRFNIQAGRNITYVVKE